MAQGPLSCVMLTATAGLLPINSANPDIGASLTVSGNLIDAVDEYQNLSVVVQYTEILTAANGNVANTTLANLQTLANSAFPAVTNSIPVGYDLTAIAPGNVYEVYTAPGNVYAGGLSGLITDMANNIMGAGDLTRFVQIYTTSQGYAALTNQFINSNTNANTIASTFGPTTGGMDNVTTGGWNQVTQAYGAFGQDLASLGRLINPKDLDMLGSPAALLKQLAAQGGLYPAVVNILKQAGITNNQIAAIAAGNLGEIDDSTNKLIYQGMTQIMGNTLQQICAVLGVLLPVARTGSSPNTINTMADLLDPVKILPNSFATLTMPTPDGLRAIYATTSGAINTNLEQYLTSTSATLPNFSRSVTVEIRTP